jgi:hypothetical protein
MGLPVAIPAACVIAINSLVLSLKFPKVSVKITVAVINYISDLLVFFLRRTFNSIISSLNDESS